MASQLRESELTELKRSVLESTRLTLVKDVNPIKFLPYLRSKSVVNYQESDLIKKCCSSSVMEGADKLIDVLCTKGDKGYDEFCKAILHDETQIHLLKILNKELERKRQAMTQRVLPVPKNNALIGAYNPTRRPLPTLNSNYTVPGSAHTTSCIECLSHPPPPHMGQPQFSPDFMRSRSPQHYTGSPHQTSVANSCSTDDRPCGQPLN